MYHHTQTQDTAAPRRPARTPAKSERVEARVTPEQKQTLVFAAELRGLSITDFVMESVQKAAEAAIHDHNVVTLTARDSLAFAEAILNPRPPSPALRAAFARHPDVATA